MRTANCPSCGAVLDGTTTSGLLQCTHCGARIELELSQAEQDRLREKEELRRYVGLSRVAMEARNWTDVFRYSGQILERDPGDADAWIDKAYAAFWQGTVEASRLQEALTYLRHAAQCAADHSRVTAAEQEFTKLHSTWHNDLGVKAFDLGKVTYAACASYSWLDAQRRSTEHYAAAMSHFVEASTWAPEDIQILRNIAITARAARWIAWGIAVEERLRRLSELETRARSDHSIGKARAGLQDGLNRLAQLRTRRGPLAPWLRRRAAARVGHLKAELDELEQSNGGLQAPVHRGKRAQTSPLIIALAIVAPGICCLASFALLLNSPVLQVPRSAEAQGSQDQESAAAVATPTRTAKPHPKPTATPVPPTAGAPEMPAAEASSVPGSACEVTSVTQVIIEPGMSAFYLFNGRMEIVEITGFSYEWTGAGQVISVDWEPEHLANIEPPAASKLQLDRSAFAQPALAGYGTRALIFRFSGGSPTTSHTLSIELDGICTITDSQ